MKKLFFVSAFALTVMISCQNEANEVISKETVTTSKTAAKSEAEPENILIYYLSTGEATYNGVSLEKATSKEAAIALEAVNSPETSRYRTNVYCHAKQPDGTSLSLVSVYDSSVNQTFYFIVVQNGSSSEVYINVNINCRMIYQTSIGILP
ncbi:hypothetical protein [Chryseobacterium indologenes]|uniref:Lipoprotein n=1 Tax=Chryseobacterium indologenes TaxID=253 RepID=A0A0N1KS14_CHRID|nr:hypothetical protein [Chryseobacterium indologenes]KPE50129.1 hypothetical protein AOB46_16965 [Chryseobacterium indologenes]